MNRRTFLKTGLAGAGAAALAPLIKVRTGSAATTGKRVVIVGIGGGLRLRESLGMAEGATMSNLFGTAPLVTRIRSSVNAPTTKFQRVTYSSEPHKAMTTPMAVTREAGWPSGRSSFIPLQRSRLPA